MPALEPGAVFEYSYEIDSENPIFLPDWTFQWSEPTLWSEYRADIPSLYNYARLTVGRLGFSIDESEELGVRRTMRHRWVMQDVPALREEPFMTTPEDYRSAIEFQLASYIDPSVGRVDFMNTWERVAIDLMEMPTFGGQLKPTRKTRQQTEALTAQLTVPLAKMQAIYDFVRTTIHWSGEYSMFPGRNADEVLKAQNGSSADIAILLISMLRAAGLEAHPMLISTRSHGRLVERYPILSQFNHLLATVEVGGQAYLLDATDPLRPYTLLPTEALNGKGWLVRKKNPQWIPVNVSARYQHTLLVDAMLDASGTLTATLQASDRDYSALDKRHVLKEVASPEAFVTTALLSDIDEVTVGSCVITNQDLVTEALKTEAAFAISGYAQVAGDFIYFNPVLLGRMEENPLRLPERTFPVDMAYPRTVVQSFNVTLPAGYAVQELPANKRARLPAEGGHFQRVMEVEDGVLVIQYQMVLNRSIYEPRYYASLQSFFDAVVAVGAEQVVLQRTRESPDDTGGGKEQ